MQMAQKHGPILPRNRDLLTDGFLDSPATHMLCVDSDIGFGPEQIQALLDTRKPFIAGTYSKKQENREIPADYTGRQEGEPFATLYPNARARGPEIDLPLWECKHVPAGFMLIERAVIERMAGAYRSLVYEVKGYGIITGLWSPTFQQGVSYAGEDIAFCRRWTNLGGEIWMHRGVVVEHYGEQVFVPREDDVTPTKANRTPDTTPEVRQDPHASVPAESKPNGQAPAVKMYGPLPVHIHPDGPS